MKNTIMYYYGFENISIIRQERRKYIKHNNDLYIICRIYNEKETLELYEITKDIPFFHKFVLNKDGSIFTMYQDFLFVLLKINDINPKISQNKNQIRLDNTKKYYLDRSDWYELWTRKNDYYEYQYEHIKGKHKVIDESINYYIGLAENAISYIASIPSNLKVQEKRGLYPKRIIEREYHNPLNYVIDYKERGLSETLKYLFLNQKYLSQNIENIILSYNCTETGYKLLYGRMLYPSMYFDIYDKVINDFENEKELVEVVKRSKEYEEYLKEIYRIISKHTEIKNIDWL